MDTHPRSADAYKLMHDGILALSRAEQQGIRVDTNYVIKKKEQLAYKIELMEAQFRESRFFRRWEHTIKRGSINIHSNTQLAHYLYNVLKLTPQKTTDSGQGATDEEALQQLGIQELSDLIEIRKLRKIKDTYLDAFLRESVDGYIHPFFNLHLVRTFRSSSDSPNFQNIPKRDKEAMKLTRKALYPRPGHQLLEIDYSGLEVRIAACYHKDPNMIHYIEDPSSDMHADMAQEIFMLDIDKSIPSHNILRQAAKNGFVFPQFYGDYYKSCAPILACTWSELPHGEWLPEQGLEIGTDEPLFLSDHLASKGICSLDDFTEHLRKIEDGFWGERFPDYAAWRDRWWTVYQKYGYIDLLTGFRCSGVMGRNDTTNYPVQGAAFHCLLWSFIELDRIMQEEKWDTKLIGQIHDAIILDVNPQELDHVVEVIKRVTCQDLPKAWPWIIVPLDVEMEICEVDCSWATKEKLKTN